MSDVLTVRILFQILLYVCIVNILHEKLVGDLMELLNRRHFGDIVVRS